MGERLQEVRLVEAIAATLIPAARFAPPECQRASCGQPKLGRSSRWPDGVALAVPGERCPDALVRQPARGATPPCLGSAVTISLLGLYRLNLTLL